MEDVAELTCGNVSMVGWWEYGSGTVVVYPDFDNY